MDSNQCHQAAIRLRDSCLTNPQQPDLEALGVLLRAACSEDPQPAATGAKTLIRTVVEDLSDRFEPALVECYVEIFSRAIAAVTPTFSSDFLRRRYADLRSAPARPLSSNKAAPRQIVILSRITLGADIAVTSVFLDALGKRFPQATVWFAGPRKNFELFAGLPRVRHWPLDYPRGGSLAERFAVASSFEGAFDEADTWLMDPDSRISQLGLLPIAPLTASLFFESRSYLPESEASLSALASSWCREYLGVVDAEPVLAPFPVALEALSGLDPPNESAPPICLSLGVGNNERKRLSDRFEASLIHCLAGTGHPVWVDSGAGGPEAEAVRAAIRASGAHAESIRLLDGSFAAFCHRIRGAALYVGYDSAGQHAAAALQVPGITLFKGYANERMFQRWQPRGPERSRVIRISPADTEDAVLGRFRECLSGALLPTLPSQA